MGVTDFPTVSVIGASRKPKRFDIQTYQGDTFNFYLTFGGATLNVTGWTASSTVKKVADNTVVPAVITISVIDIVNKRFLISVDSETLSPTEEYKYDVQVVSPGTPPDKRTFIGGKITTTEDITEP